MIPYEPHAELVTAYNRYMERAEGWVLFLDQDLFLCNPAWYAICLNAIQAHPEAGIITCWTNRLCKSNHFQRDRNAPKGNDVEEHCAYARWKWDASGESFTSYQLGEFAGFFLLTNRRTWEDVGGFQSVNGGSLLGVDHDYAQRVVSAGRSIIRLDGLYVYHRYAREWRW